MSLEKDFTNFALEIKETQGKILQSLENLSGYISAVSSNTKDVASKLEKHLLDNDAHGLGIGRSSNSALVGWLGITISILTLAVMAFKMKQP